MSDTALDMIIIGAGPAGLGAAIYAVRAGFRVLVLEKGIPGGQIINTTEVDNYLGLPGITGWEIGTTFKDHAEKIGVEFASDEVESVDLSGEIKIINGHNGSYRSRFCILAMGAHHSKLCVPGEDSHVGMGVSYCATCDGAFFRNRSVIVVGGGNIAVTDALYLSSLCEKVVLIHRRDELRADKILQDKLMAADNISVIWNSTVTEIIGDGVVSGAKVLDKTTGEVSEIPADGVFVAIGMQPETTILTGQLELDEKGYIIASEDCRTNVSGVYAVGDIRTKAVRQVITAAADGACAVHSAEVDKLSK